MTVPATNPATHRRNDPPDEPDRRAMTIAATDPATRPVTRPQTGAAAAVAPGAARAWLLASRPRTLIAAAAPVLVGTACASAAGGFRAGPAAAALIGALWLQIGANFANDAYDFERGADGADRVGPVRAAAAGLLTPAQLERGMWCAFGLATIAGAYLAWVAGWTVIAIGVASVIAGIAYTGGPYPLGYHGLGDVFVMAFFGFAAVCGTAFVQVGAVPAAAWWAAVPVGALATAILAVNNIRDRDGDRRAGKRTLAVRLGATGGRLEYVGVLALAYATPPVMVALALAGSWALAPLATLPAGIALARRVWTRRDAPGLDACLAGTAMLLFGYSALFAAGLAV